MNPTTHEVDCRISYGQLLLEDEHGLSSADYVGIESCSSLPVGELCLLRADVTGLGGVTRLRVSGCQKHTREFLLMGFDVGPIYKPGILTAEIWIRNISPVPRRFRAKLVGPLRQLYPQLRNGLLVNDPPQPGGAS